MGTIYGNEHKDSLAALYTPEQLENFSCVLKDVCLLPLNLSLWKISQPWQVPERKINDTLIWLVKKGEFEGTVKKRTKQLCAGEGVIVPENTPHAFRFAGQCTQGEAFVIHLHAQNLFHETFHTMFSSPFFKIRYPEAVFTSLLRAVALKNVNNDAAFSYAKDIIRELLLENMETADFKLQESRKPDMRIQKAIQYLSQNYARDISILDIAAAVNLHEVQFRRLFRTYTGISPHTCLQRVRLQHAAEMLVNSFASLATIIRESGFHSESYFCLVFRKTYGISPQAYRKNYRDL